MKRFAVFLLLFACFVVTAEECQPWTFSYLSRPVLPSRFITRHHEFRELLERIHGLINEGEYDVVSLILLSKISSLDFNTRHPDKFEKLVALLHIDAALDYFLRDKRQQGLNKQYIAFYIFGRLDNNWPVLGEEVSHRFYYGLGFTEDEIINRNRSFLSSAVYSLTIRNNSYFPNSFSRFVNIVGHLPVLHFHHFYDIHAFGEFVSSFNSFYFDNVTNDANFIDFINSFADDFALLDYIVSLEEVDLIPPQPMFSEREIEDIIAEYWHEDDETRIFYSPLWDLNATLQTLSADLFYMRDFSEDIRIFANPVFMEGAQRAVEAVDIGIPVIEFPIFCITESSLPTHQLIVFVTFRQARAEAFFNRYYGNK